MTTTFYKHNFTGYRRSEPLMFWVALLLGSVVLHAAAFFSIRLGAVVSVDAIQTEPALIELIEIAPIIESPESVSAAANKITTVPPVTSKATSPNSVEISEPSKTVPPTLGNTKLLSQIKSSPRIAKAQKEKKQSISSIKINRSPAVVPKKIAIAQVKATHSQPSVSSRSPSKLKVSAKSVTVRSPSIKAAAKPIAVKPVVKRSPSIKPVPKPIAVKPVVKRSPSIKAAAKPIAVKPVVKRSPSIKAAPKPSVAVKPVVKPSPTAKPKASPKPTEKRSQPVKAMPYPTQTVQKRDREPLSPTPQPPENQHSSGVVATFDLGSIRSGDRDIPEQLAAPEQNQRQFPSVLDSLQFGLSEGSALVLQVLVEIDERGKLTAIKQVNAVENSSQPQPTAKTTDYLGLAKQLLKDWKFHPAYSGGQPVYSELWLRLTVKAL